MQAARLLAAGAFALAAAMMSAAVTAQAQDFPNKPVRIIVSLSAGGILGTDYTANQPPDGYTILMSSSGPMVISPSLPKKLATDPLTAMVPVILVADVANVLVTAPELNIKSMQELVQKGKANPGDLNYASTGVGTVARLSGAAFSEKAGIQTTHVPYKGAEAVRDVIAGRDFADLVRRDYEGWKPVIQRTGAGAN